MGKSSPSPPAAPDPAATANAQAGLNADTARLQALLGRYAQNTPYGSLTWNRPAARTGALAGPAPGADPATIHNQQFMGPLPASRPAAAPGSWLAMGGNSYFNLDTGRTEQFDTAPGTKRGVTEDIFNVMAPGGTATGTGGTLGFDSPMAAGGPAGVNPSADGSAYDPNDVWESTITLSPEGQELFDTQNRISRSLAGLAEGGIGRVSAATAQPFSLDGLPGAPRADAESRKRVEESLFNRSKSYLDPIYQQRERELDTSLSDRGIPLGSEAWQTARGNFDRARQSDYQNAIDSSIQGGGAEESRAFGLASSARERAIQEQAYLRSQPLNELAALLGQSGGVSLPQFAQPGGVGVAPADITGPMALNYQGQLANYNQQQQRSSAGLGGLFGLAGTLGAGALAGPAGSAGSRLFGWL